jgi:rubrerythrin
MPEEDALRPIRELLEKVRERVDYAIARLKTFEEVRSLRWRCSKCGYLKRFTRPIPAEIAPPCPRCAGAEFGPAE